MAELRRVRKGVVKFPVSWKLPQNAKGYPHYLEELPSKA
jgi:hypothetical protein